MPNRLADETSPYLLQHADNPVDWWPWCEDAPATARAENKPILLSIGYSACHWCHVMAHESFEDEDTAALMNARYVNIKVDREERPDLDKIYQLTHQIMTQRPGGWPLTVILDPKTQAPFMAGTYFPRESRYSMPAFPDVLRQVADWYQANQDKLGEQKQRLEEVFERLEPDPADAPPDEAALAAARKQLQANFDAEYGGFTGAPKFPHPPSLELLLRLARAEDTEAGEMARFSLRRMCRGGLFDQIGGGFYRYAVDARWEIPHFEKMLYDNGPLLALTARLAADTGERPFSIAAHATADWALREMQSPQGGFYSSLDADSEGGEGAFYIWSAAQVREILQEHQQGELLAELLEVHYGLNGEPNFEGRHHLQVRQPIEDIAAERGESAADIACLIDTARQKLFEARERRPRPGRDDKILTGWNALMIGGMAAAHRHLQRADCLAAARAALAFIRDHLWRDDRLLAVYKDGRAHTSGYLDDHAFMLDALLAILQADWRSADLAWAQQIADTLLEHFEDTEAGGFYFTAHDHERLLHRPKPLGDESTPAGNAVAARALQHLGWLVGEPRYLDAAEAVLKLAAQAMRDYPMAHMSLLQALKDYRQPPEIVILRGETDNLNEWRQAADNGSRMVFAIPDDAEPLPPGLADKKPQDQPVAYVCRGMTCSLPITRIEDLNQGE